jgi:DNA-binding transcriptional regulator YdaS (Cro superfamily)
MSTRELRIFHIRRAFELAGGAKAFAKELGITHQAAYHYIKKGVVPLDRAVQIEREYGVSAMNLVDPKLASSVRQLMALGE